MIRPKSPPSIAVQKHTMRLRSIQYANPVTPL